MCASTSEQWKMVNITGEASLLLSSAVTINSTIIEMAQHSQLSAFRLIFVELMFFQQNLISTII